MVSDDEDSLTRLNTAINKSMILMDTPMEQETAKGRSGKILKIDTQAQTPSALNSSISEPSNSSRKSILKKSRASEGEGDSQNPESASPLSTRLPRSSVDNCAPRPRNLQDFLTEGEDVASYPPDSTFSLEDLSDDEEMWLMDVPKTVDPRDLRGQTLSLGHKSKLKLGEERYCAVARNTDDRLTWVLGSGNSEEPFKAVNLRPEGYLVVRRKLSGMSKRTNDIADVVVDVPSFPPNLKVRHPFFGPCTAPSTRSSPTSKQSRRRAKCS